jgi:hypothetical protein
VCRWTFKMLALLVTASCSNDGTPRNVERCPDGSQEANCNAMDGGGGAGGALSTGGGAPGGTAGAPSIAGGGSSACEAWVANLDAACPDTASDAELKTCEQATLQYWPIGCGPKWDAYLDCVAQAPIDCNQGPSGCENQQSDYRFCDSQFAIATLCTRAPSEDDLCPPIAPYAFGCLAPVPTGCLPLSTGAADNGACCPAFPPH